tara:strand:- start:2540 stop:2785 length:246 start_codon:yes stop_codon:yes gene_type:complete
LVGKVFFADVDFSRGGAFGSGDDQDVGDLVAKAIMSSAASMGDGTCDPAKCGCDDHHLSSLALKVFFDVNNSTVIDRKIWQ